MEERSLNHTDDLYTRMKTVEKDLDELNKAILKFKKDLEEELYNLSGIVDQMREEE